MNIMIPITFEHDDKNKLKMEILHPRMHIYVCINSNHKSFGEVQWKYYTTNILILLQFN